MSHKLPPPSPARSLGPRFRTGSDVRPATNLTRHGFYVSGSVAQLGSIHDGVLEFPELGDFPVRVRVRAADAQHTHCHFYDLSLKDQAMLMGLLARYQDGGEDAINDLSYDEIARGDGSKPLAQAQARIQKSVNGNGSAHVHANSTNGNSTPTARDERVEQTKAATKNGKVTVPEVKASSSQPAVKKSTGMIAMVVLLIGIVTIGTLVYLFFRSQSSIQVQSAVLLGNYVPIKATSEGMIEDVFVREGDLVREGTPLFRVVDQRLEGVYAEAKATLVSATMERDSAAKAVENAKTQFAIVAKSLSGDLAVAESGVVLAETELKRASSLSKRLKPLVDRGMILRAKYEEAQMGVDAAVAALAMSKAELARLNERKETLEEANVLMVGDRVDQSLPLAESRLASADAKLAELNARLEHLEGQRRGFTVVAQQAGTVYASYLKKGSFVKVGGEVLAIGTREESWAVGHVTQKMAMKVLPGQKVRVKMPALGVVETGEVASVGHRGVYSQNGWNPDFRADPTMVPIKVSLPDMPYKIPAGLRIGMVIELDYEWPWDRREPLLDDEVPDSATWTNDLVTQ